MSSFAASSWKEQLRCNSREILESLYLHVKSKLLSYFNLQSGNSSILIELITETQAHFNLPEQEINPILHPTISGSQKILSITTQLESLSICRRDVDVKKEFLHLLLNKKGALSNLVKCVIHEKFADTVRIEITVDVEETVEDTTPLTQTRNTRLQRNDSQLAFSQSVLLSFEFIVTIGIGMALLGIVLLYVAIQMITGTSNPTPQNYTIHAVDTKVISQQPSFVPEIQTKPYPYFQSPNSKGHGKTLGTAERETSVAITTTTATTKATSASNAPVLPEKKTRPKYKIHVTTYNDLISSLSKRNPSHVSIDFENPVHWPNGLFLMINAIGINKLELDGYLTVDILVEILSKTPNVKQLRLKNTGNRFCQRNQGQLNLVKSIQSRFYLPRLETLTLENFTTCAEVYETLVIHSEKTWNLKGFKIHRGIVDDSNHIFIQEMLHRSRNTLMQFILTETQLEMSVPLLEVNGGLRLPKVNLLKVDSLPRNHTRGTIPIGSAISKMFPNLRIFRSEHGYLPWRNMSHILVLKNLTKLTIGIDIPENHHDFNLAFLRKSFPSLKEAKLTLGFQNCDGEKKTVTGWETVRESLGEISIRSTCKLFASFKNSDQARLYREEKYSRENSWYIFIYRLIEDRR